MKPMVEQIIEKNEILAMVARRDFKPDGVNFLTPENFSLHMGVSSYNKGSLLKPHIQLQRERVILNI